MPTLCLNMIVKNESKIIKKLFDSISPIIDCYCICDTGSTDNTVEYIKEYFSEKNIPGEVYYEEFKNFGYNRSYALEKCVGMSDYVLLMDADMELIIKNFTKDMLCKDNYYILQGNDSFYYNNVRIVRNDGNCQYVGVTHEYIDLKKNKDVQSFSKDIIFINDIGNGGCKDNKYTRDIALLTKGIEDEPKNSRYHFYLANSYHDSGKYEEAIKYYECVVKMNGWGQERWYSLYKMGHCYKKMNNIKSAVYSWMEALDICKNRVENIYEMVNHYRCREKYETANYYYNIALDVLKKLNNSEKDAFLFLHNDVYTWKLYFEYYVLAYYISEKNIKNTNSAIVNILNNSDDGNSINISISNMKFYKNILSKKKIAYFTNTIEQEINYETIKFNSSSSSIIDYNGGYLMNIRYVNYTITSNGSYINCDKNVITLNKRFELNRDFEVISERLVDYEFLNKRIDGIEDVRIFNSADGVKFIGVSEHNDKRIGVVYGNYNKENIISNEINSSFSNNNCEKNWVLFNDKENNLRVVYEWFPLKICRIDETKNSLELMETKTNVPNFFKKIRGSSNAYFYNNEYWFVGHIVSYESPRHYYHVLMIFDENMNLQRYTAPFKFEGEPIEYCIGLIVEPTRVIMNYSVWDRSTILGVYDMQYIQKELVYKN
jgi:glycosyltransferase involved in cell wall biosynthesis